MVNSAMKNYTEVKIEGSFFERSYRNPLTKVFQYEYGLYSAVADLFDHVECKSMCVDSLKMYFKELPLKGQDENAPEEKETVDKKNKKMNQEKLVENMKTMVSAYLVGNVEFPMMEQCAAEVSTVTRADGTHWFVFTDGIYGFALHLKLGKNKKPLE